MARCPAVRTDQSKVASYTRKATKPLHVAEHDTTPPSLHGAAKVKPYLPLSVLSDSKRSGTDCRSLVFRHTSVQHHELRPQILSTYIRVQIQGLQSRAQSVT